MDALAVPHTVHRLDIRVGGLMVVAKTARAQVALGRAFEHRQVQIYRAMVIGRIEGTGRIEEPIEGRSAMTRYAVVQHTPSWSLGWWTTLDLWPETGRTHHQLRRHMAAMGTPIVGDDLYTGSIRNIRKKGLYLYSIGLEMRHPIGGEPIKIRLARPGGMRFVVGRSAEEYSVNRESIVRPGLHSFP